MVEMTAFSLISGRAIATFLNFCVSHGSTATFLRGGKNIIFILQIIYCCFQRWKNFENRLTVDEVIANSFDTTFTLSEMT